MGVALAVAGSVAHGADDQRGVSGRRGHPPRLVRPGATRARVSRRARRGGPDTRLRVQAAQRPAWGVAVLAAIPARREPRQLPSRSGDDDAAAAWREAREVDGYDCVLQNAVGARGSGLAVTGVGAGGSGLAVTVAAGVAEASRILRGAGAGGSGLAVMGVGAGGSGLAVTE